MNRPTPHLLACLLGAVVLSLAAFTASAQTVSVALNSVDATDTTDGTPPTAVEAQLAAQHDADRNCLRHTGTRIVPRDKTGKRCIPQHGSVYTREDLDRTGEIDMGRALRRLDTSIR